MTPGFTAELALDRKFGNYRGNQAGLTSRNQLRLAPLVPRIRPATKIVSETVRGFWGCEGFCTWYCGGRTEM